MIHMAAEYMAVDLEARLNVLESKVQELVDIEAIRDLRFRYHEYINEAKFTEIAGLFTEDGDLLFGHLGNAQTNHATSARIIEYFSDSYQNQKEAIHKAEVFLSICDYIARHAPLFSRKGLMETLDGGLLSVDPALLRAVGNRPGVLYVRGELADERVYRTAEGELRILPS